MGLFSSKNDRVIADCQDKLSSYEKLISELSDEVRSLENQLSGERAVFRHEKEEMSNAIARLMKSGGDWSSLPRVLYDAIDLYDTATPSSYIYFQDALAEIPPFRVVDFKLRKQNSKNVPDGWEVEKGGVVVLYEGAVIGKFSPEDVEKYELSTSRVNRGFVTPPYVDADDGFRINDRYVPQLFI